MLLVSLNWIFIAFTCFVSGFGVLYLIEKLFGYHFNRIVSCMMAGITVLTAYAQWFSLFHKVSHLSDTILLVIDLFILLKLNVPMGRLLVHQLDQISNKKFGVGAILVILICFFTSRGSFISDTNLYHAQAIRWIEEYGVIKGLANLQSRTAYNSSIFCLSALYSMKYLFCQSMHSVQGFMAACLAVLCLDLDRLFISRKVKLSDFARIGAIYYLTLLYRELMSPSSDTAVMIVLFYIIIRWLDLLEEGETDTVPWSALCVMGVLAVTLKLTAGLILILLIKPATALIKEKKGKQIAFFLLAGILVIAPYLIRNVLLSGWLLYPSTAIDLFSVDWKVPKEIAEADAYQIKIWGKGIHDYSLYFGGPAVWMPNWFKTVLTSTEKMIILGDFVSLGMYLFMVVKQLWKRAEGKWDELLVITTVVASYLFWQFSAPLTRYGYVYILLLPLLCFGCLYIWMFHQSGQRILLTAILGLLLWKGIVLMQGIGDEYLLDCYVKQQDYDTNEGDNYVEPFEVNGHTFYYRVSGYHFLPGGNRYTFEMRGNKMKNGFRYYPCNEMDVFGKELEQYDWD